jgi:hypothetical protein
MAKKPRKPKDLSKQIYGNAQELTAMVFGYDLTTDDGKAAIDNLLSSYQIESGGGYVIDGGVAKKVDPKKTFDSDRFFSDMDLMLGFGEGDFEGISTANLTINKNRDLINEQIKKNVFRDQGGSVAGFNLKYDNEGNLHRGKGPYDSIDYQEKAYKQHETAINQAAVDYEKETRQAVKDANEARKPRNKASIEDIRKTPDLLLGIPEEKQRELADRAMYGQGRKKEVYPSAIAAKMKNATALDSFSAKTLADNDFLFKIDASDDVLNAVYQNVHDKKWQTDYIKRKYNDGGFSQYEFKAKKYDDLTKAQKQMLMDEYHRTDLQQFKDNFDYVDLDESALGDPNKKYINRGYSANRARQNYMQRTYFNGVDPNSGDFDKAFNSAIKNATTDEQAKALEAYQKYARDTFNAGKTTRLQGAEEFMMERLSKKEAQQASKLLGHEMGDAGKALMKGLGNDGIGAASKLKGLKVAGGIAAGMVALWAAGEIWDE